MHILWTLPVPSTSLLEGGVTLEKGVRREVALRFSYESDSGGTRRRAALLFQGVEAFKCTYNGAIDTLMLEGYDRLVDRGSSDWLVEISSNLKKRNEKVDGLAHLMITFDDGPCYEAVCRSFRIEEA